MTIPLHRPLLPLALCFLLGACAITRVEPPAPVLAAPQFKESGLWQKATAAGPDAVPDAWWTLFKDPVLDDLQQRLVVGNENLKSLAAAVVSARAVLAASRSALLPTLSAGLSATRSGNSVTSASTATQNPGNSVALTAGGSWDLDLWGRLAQSSGAAESSLQASANDLAAARLSAQAVLAQSYFSLRTTEAQQGLLFRSTRAYQRALELTQARYDGGIAMRTDVLQAQTQLRSAQAQLADVTAQRAQLEHAIAVLLGLQPSSLSIEVTGKVADAPTIPSTLPSTLLERRPDIAAARSRLLAAYGQIGVADAAFFPALTLTGNAQFAQSTLATLLNEPNFLWSVGSSLAQSVLDGGQRKLASAQARSGAEQATSNYRQTVLTALQEVEDNLVLADQLQREAQLQQEASQFAQRNLEITLDQYRSGTVNYLSVVAAQNAALNSESTLLGVRNRQLAAVNQLLKNIAGRWESVSAK